MLSGWTGALESKLTIFGGPFVALTLYAVIGWILMITPENIANLIYLGMPEIKDNIKSILHVNLEVKETLGSVQIQKWIYESIQHSTLSYIHAFKFRFLDTGKKHYKKEMICTFFE